MMMVEVPESLSSLPSAQANKVKQLFDYIATGVRPRFMVLDLQSDLLDWATEYAKVHEVCRDVKAAVDAGGAVPDGVMARALKLWLAQVKWEASQGGAGAEGQAPESAGKGGAAAGGKKEERGKSPPKGKGAPPTKGMEMG